MGLGVAGSIAVGTAAAGLGSAAMNSMAQGSAARKQVGAENAATALQQQMYQANVGRMQPWVDNGQQNMGMLASQMPNLTAKFNPTQAQLEQTPGYQFALSQGMQATQNGQAAQGLGNSGAAMKGAEQYAQGLASTTYQQQFQNYLGQNQQIYNMLNGQSALGENAAAQVGTNAAQMAGGMATTQVGAGNAAAAGIMGQNNAMNGMLGGAGSNLQSGLMTGNTLAGLIQGASGGTGAAAAAANGAASFPALTGGAINLGGIF